MKFSYLLQTGLFLVAVCCHAPDRKIVSGMSLSEASILLKGAGYKEITDHVGIKTRAHSWWISPNNTCVTVVPSDDGCRVEWFWIAEKGKGYEGASAWEPKDTVDVLNLN